MKTLFIIIGIVFTGIVVVQLFAINGQKNIESYPYEVIEVYDAFEIRSYEAALFTSVQLSIKDYKKASGEGFSVLAGYIFGDNERNEKIAMTSPVAMTLEDSMTMMFMVPKKFNQETLPQPRQSEIVFKSEPAKTLAALQFGGWANDQKIKKHLQQLKSALKKQGITHTDQFYFFGYNPPYEIFNRKNEIVVELK
jgi:hypothetical protein